MKVSIIKNVSKKGITVKAKNGMEVYLPPGQEFEDIDVSNLEKLGEKVTYVSNLTEVNKKNKYKAILHG